MKTVPAWGKSSSIRRDGSFSLSQICIRLSRKASISFRFSQLISR